MPDGIPWDGDTGLFLEKVSWHSANRVINTLSRMPTEPYQEEVWDCEDNCFSGVAEARYRHFGVPIGIATGKGVEPPEIKDKKHAVIVIWFEDMGVMKTRYYDPTFGCEVERFNTKSTIAFPIHGARANKAAFSLDYKWNFDLIGLVENDLKNRNFEHFPKPTGGERLYDWEKFYLRNDHVFYWFAQCRKRYKGAPVGVAFGVAKSEWHPEPGDYAALVLWKDYDNYEFWSIWKGQKIEDLGVTFTPRVVVV